MPSQSQHQTKAKSNRDFLSQIDRNARSDWAVVVAFYTAVHLVERLRSLDGQHSTNHQERLSFVQASHRNIHTEYHQLYNLSRIARYDSNSYFYSQISNEDVEKIVVGEWLTIIEKYVDSYAKR